MSVVELSAGERMYAAVVAALGALSDVVASETADAGTYSYRYASLGSIMPKVRPVLAEHKLALSQLVTAHDGELTVATMLVHEGGQTFSSGAMSMKAPQQPQQVGSLISYLRRYQLLALLGLAVEDDDASSAQTAQHPAGEHRGTYPSSTAGEPMTEKQAGMIAARFRELSMSDDDSRGDRLALIIDVIGHDIGRTTEITKAEASKVIDELTKLVADLTASRPYEAGGYDS